jgi:type II secretory ATPase GspE/PulE/Tfp pilus assembly ATPase PilB-like protein
VFSTLHTNDAPSSFVRLVDVGVKPFLVASGVRAVLAQRLVRTLCSTCKETYDPPELEKRRLCLPVEWDKVTLMHGAGCDNCHGSGHQGRLGIYELLKMDDEIRKLILEGASSIKLRRKARMNGMSTLRDDAWKKALAGIATLEEVNRRTKADEPLKAETAEPAPAAAG